MGIALAAGTWATAIGVGVSLVSAAASAAMSIQQSNQQKDAQEKYNKKLTEDAIRQYGELDKAESDAIYESHAQSLEAQREYLSARSQVELQAAVTGTYGNSINLAIQDLNTGVGGRMAEIAYQRESVLDAIDKKAEQIQRSPSLNADTTIQMPSYYKAFTSALNTYSVVDSVSTKIGTAYDSGKIAKQTKAKPKRTAYYH